MVNLKSDESIREFIIWISNAAMGEDINIPEISFGYQLEHRVSYDEDCPIQYFKKHVGEFLPDSVERLRKFLSKA